LYFVLGFLFYLCSVLGLMRLNILLPLALKIYYGLINLNIC
jgi:hypothetical protein